VLNFIFQIGYVIVTKLLTEAKALQILVLSAMLSNNYRMKKDEKTSRCFAIKTTVSRLDRFNDSRVPAITLK
jgi:hypothetical protein